MPASKVLGQWLEAADAHELVVAPSPWWPDPRHATDAFLDETPVAPDGHEPITEWAQAWREADTAGRSRPSTESSRSIPCPNPPLPVF